MDLDAVNPDDVRDRVIRIGGLPGRVHPDDAVETVGTTSPAGRPAAAGSEEQRQVFLAGG